MNIYNYDKFIELGPVQYKIMRLRNILDLSKEQVSDIELLKQSTGTLFKLGVEIEILKYTIITECKKNIIGKFVLWVINKLNQ